MNIRTAPQRGCNQCESLILVALIGIIAAIAIPNLLAAKRSSNAASAIKTLRMLHTAQMSYFLGIGRGNFAGELARLGDFNSSSVGCLDGCSPPPPQNPEPHSGYILGPIRKQNATPTNPARYWVINRPIRACGPFQTSKDIFYVDETGILRHSCSPTVWPDETSDPIY